MKSAVDVEKFTFINVVVFITDLVLFVCRFLCILQRSVKYEDIAGNQGEVFLAMSECNRLMCWLITL